MNQTSTATSPDAGGDRSAAIRTLNDRLRRECIGGQRMITRGISALPREAIATIVKAVAAYETFDPGSDPYGEHDFGSLTVENRHILFKIDYYDVNLRYASADATNPAITRRVLTIMLAEEY